MMSLGGSDDDFQPLSDNGCCQQGNECMQQFLTNPVTAGTIVMATTTKPRQETLNTQKEQHRLAMSLIFMAMSNENQVDNEQRNNRR